MVGLNPLTYMREELRHTPTVFHRYMYDRLLWDDRMVGLVGPRGVGKSTMVKQYLLSRPDRDKWLYVSADNSWFYEHSLIRLADEFVREDGQHLIIDEVHKYKGWSRKCGRFGLTY